jgi:murein DD-endopeptidase MepM/ murein hydrolase activator NlpD
MAKKKNHGIDNFDDINLDDLDFDFDDPFDPKSRDDRNPVTRFARGAVRGAAGEMISPSFYKGVIRKALPKEYGDALDDIDTIARMGSELYNKSAKELKPSLLESKKIAKNYIPRDTKYLPKAIREWLHEDIIEVARLSPEQQQEMQLEIEMNEMFKTNLIENAKFQEETRRRETLKLMVERKHHVRSIATLESIRSGMSRLVGYQDNVTARYQRKHLEIAYRHLFVARDSLQAFKNTSAEQTLILKDILKNTGLPDHVKMHAKDVLVKGVRERFIKPWEDKAVRGVSGLTQRVGSNFSKYITQQVDTIKNTIDNLNMMAGGMGEGGGDTAGTAGSVGGSMAANWAGAKLFEYLANKYGADKVRSGAARIGLARKNAGGAAFDWAERQTAGGPAERLDRYGNRIASTRSGIDGLLGEDEEGNRGFSQIGGIKGWLKTFTAEMLGSRDMDKKVAHNFNEYSEDPVALNALTRKSIVEIIPGYLARILREVTVANNGDPKTELQEYSLSRNTFVTQSGKRADILRRIKEKGGVNSTAIDLDYALKANDQNNTLSPAAQAALKRTLAMNSVQGKTFDVNKLATKEAYDTTIDMNIRKELAEHFKRTYETDRTYALGQNPDLDERKNKAADEYYKLHTRFPDLVNEIQEQIAKGYTVDLEALGLVRVDDEGTHLNFDAIYDLVVAEDKLRKKKGGKSGGGAKGGLKPKTEAKYSYSKAKRSVDGYRKLLTRNPTTTRNAAKMQSGGGRSSSTAAQMGGLMNMFTSKFGVSMDWAGMMGKGKDFLNRQSNGKTFTGLKAKAAEYASKSSAEVKALVDSISSEYGPDIAQKLEDAIELARKAQSNPEAKSKLIVGVLKDQVRTLMSERPKDLASFIEKVRENQGDSVAEEILQHARRLGKGRIAAVGEGASGSGGFGGNSVASNSSDIEAMDWHAKVLAVLSESLSFHQQNREILANINEQLLQGITVNGGEGGNGGRKYGLRQGIRSFIGGVMTGTGKVISGAGSVYGTLLKGTAKALGLGFKIGNNILGVAARKIGMIGRQGDIYVRGRKEPALTARGIKDGRYLDVNTNKVIKKFEDIKGAVLDLKEDNTMVLSEEDFKRGIFDIRGTPILRQVTSALMKSYSVIFSPVALAAKLATTGLNAVAKVLMGPKDVYVKGEMNAPRLMARIFKEGGYYSHRTGKPLKHWKDIDGPVNYIDQGGAVTMVLTADDLHNKGIVDRNGRQLKTMADRIGGALAWGGRKVVGAVKGVYNLAATTVKASYKITSALIGGFGRFVGRGLGLKIKPKSLEEADAINGKQSVEILQKIHDILDRRLPGGKKRFGDGDGDGDRDGSWQDKLSQGKKKAGELAIAAKAAAAKKKAAAEAAGEGGGDTTIIGGIPGLDKLGELAKKGGKGLWNLLKKIPGKSLLGRIGIGAGATALAGGAAAGGTAAATAGAGAAAGGAAAGGGLLAAAGGVLGSIAAVIASPVVLIALGIAAVGVGGYFLYKALKDKHLRNIRLLQYGVNPENSDEAKRVLSLEEFIIPSVRFGGTTANVLLDKRTLNGALEAFGLDLKDKDAVQRFLAWFEDRFKPVLLKNLAAVRAVSPETRLKDVDDLDKAQKAEVLKKIEFPYDGSGPYNAYASPFSNDGLKIEVSQIRDAIERAKVAFASKGDKVKDPGAKGAVVAGAASSTLGGGSASERTANTLDPNNVGKPTALGNLTAGMKAGAGVTVVGGVAGSFGRKSNINALDIIRFKAYGLVELDIDKVRMLQDLERGVWADLTYSGDGVATFNGSAEDYYGKYGSAFGGEQTAWITWFTNRFLPVATTYATAVKKVSSTVTVETASVYLPAYLQLQVGSALMGAKTPGRFFSSSIWNMLDSPWVNYTLNRMSTSVLGNLATIEKNAKETKHNDPGKAPSTGGVASRVATNGNNGSNNPTPQATKPSATLPNTKAPVAETPAQRRATNAPAPMSHTGVATPAASGSITAGMIMPTKGRISSPYGMRVHPVTGELKMHNGIDIAAPRGAPVYAAMDGVITRREFMNGYGNCIYIKHADGRVTRYGHMNQFQPGLSVGSEVRQGAIIGYVGSTGKSSGNHLHFEIRANDSGNAGSVDPLKSVGNDPIASAAKAGLKSDVAAAKSDAKGSEDFSLEGEDTVASTVTNKPVASAALTGDATKAPATSNTPVGITTPSDALKSTTAKMDASVIDSAENRKRANATAEMRSQQSNAELSGGVGAMVAVMEEQLDTQRKMLKVLEKISKGMEEVAANSGKTEKTAEEPKPTDGRNSSPKGNNTPVKLAPISMKKVM